MFNLDDLRWLVSTDAELWLAQARQALAGSSGEIAPLLQILRKDLSAERARLVSEQAMLRLAAREKFSRAERMFFTRKGLEQSTDEQVATVKSERFAGCDSVADLCCGIGGDLVALATRGPHVVAGVELDPAVAILAEANLRAYDCAGASVVVGDAAQFAVANFAAWHIDPDRRAEGHRTSRVEHFQPPVEALDRLLAANPNAALKLAPASDVPAHWQAAERSWLGSRGECRQQVVWHGALARFPGLHTATVVDALSGPRSIAGRPDQPIPVAGSLGRYLLEPHAAVLAAKLTGEVCRAHGLGAVSSGVAYLTGDTFVEEPACEAFEILEVLQLDQKKLRAYCRERNIGRLEIKKRGVHLDPAKLRQAIVASGDNEAMLVLTPLAGRVRTLVVRRVTPAPPADRAAR